MEATPKDVLYAIKDAAESLGIFARVQFEPIKSRDNLLKKDFPRLSIWKDATIQSGEQINRTSFTLEFTDLDTKMEAESTVQMDIITDLEQVAALLFEELDRRRVVNIKKNPYSGSAPFYGSYNNGLTGFEIVYQFPILRPCKLP